MPQKFRPAGDYWLLKVSTLKVKGLSSWQCVNFSICFCCTYHEWNLQQRGQLILILNRCLWMYQPSLVWKDTVWSNQNIWCNCLAKHFYFEDISQNLLCLLHRWTQSYKTQTDMTKVLGIKYLGYKADHSHASSADIKNKWSPTSTCSMCLHGMYRDKFTISAFI